MSQLTLSPEEIEQRKRRVEAAPFGAKMNFLYPRYNSSAEIKRAVSEIRFDFEKDLILTTYHTAVTQLVLKFMDEDLKNGIPEQPLSLIR